jgi:hypothetical protein
MQRLNGGERQKRERNISCKQTKSKQTNKQTNKQPNKYKIAIHKLRGYAYKPENESTGKKRNEQRAKYIHFLMNNNC